MSGQDATPEVIPGQLDLVEEVEAVERGWKVLRGDCVAQMRAMPEASIDAVICDPPYGLSTEPDAAEVLRHWLAGDDYAHRGGGFMGRTWDSFVPGPVYWRECFRVLRPGGHLVAFGGTRTADLLGMAIRLAGFERRDTLAWLYGEGFPKSLDVSKAIEWEARPLVRTWLGPHGTAEADTRVDAAHADIARRAIAQDGHQGDGTALKPAHEPIALARKPLAGTVAQTVLEYGTGALNVDGCRIAAGEDHRAKCDSVVGLDSNRNGAAYGEWKGERESSWSPEGRWPANVVLSHTSDCVPAGTRKVKGSGRHLPEEQRSAAGGNGVTHGQMEGVVGRSYTDGDGTETMKAWKCSPDCPVRMLDGHAGFGDQGGSASRFFATFGRSCGEGSIEVVSTSAGKRVGSSDVNSLTDGCGSKPTDPSRPDTTSITGTTTVSTTISPTSNSSSADDTSSTTPVSEPLSSSEMVSGAALDAGSGSPSPSTPSDATASGKGIASPASASISASGGRGTGRSTPPTCAPIEPGAERFRYCAKASTAEREAGLEGFKAVHRGDGNKWTDQDYRVADGERPPSAESGPRRNVHPTVKPIDLMRWLVRLVTPPGGLVLDPFCGSGTTGAAAALEGFEFIGIERDEEYAALAEARIRWWSEQPKGIATDKALKGDKKRSKVADTGQLELLG